MGENVKKGWKIKYYKGLGTSNREECISYFRNLEHHRKEFVYEGKEHAYRNEMDLLQVLKMAMRSKWYSPRKESSIGRNGYSTTLEEANNLWT